MKLRVTQEGVIEGLRAVGYHGRLGSEQTPAQRGAVYADASNHLVRLLPEPHARSGEVAVQTLSSTPLAEDVPLPGHGTRAGPWPARPGDFFLVLGEAARHHARADVDREMLGEPGRVRRFLVWLAGVEARSDALTAERIGPLAAWYCSPDEAACLKARLAPYDRAHLLEVARVGSDREIQEAALRLSRAAVNDADVYLAVAALRRVAYPRWEPVLTAGVAEKRPAEREALVRQAQAILPERSILIPPVEAPPPSVHPARDRVRNRQRVA